METFFYTSPERIISQTEGFNHHSHECDSQETMNMRHFSQYSVGRVHIEGRTFPVQDLYLESVLSLTGYRPPLRKLKKDSGFRPDVFGEGVSPTH